MPIDPRLSLMVQPLQIESPVNALAKVMSLKESQQGMQLNQMKVDEAKRAVENQNALRARLADPNLNLDDPRTQDEIYGLGGGGILKDRADAGRLSAQQKKTEIEAAKEKLGVLKLTAGSVMASPTVDNARAQLARFGQLTGEDITDDMAQLEALNGDPEAIRRWAAGYALEADKLLPKFETRDLGGTVERVGYDPITGAPIGKPTVARKTMTPGEVARVGQEGQRIEIAQKDLDRKTGTGDVSLSTKDKQKREQSFPKAKLAFEQTESGFDKMIADLKALKDDPGLENITGMVYGRMPESTNMTREARRAMALYNNILARGQFQELQNMRNASPTGGALGNISNQEGQILRQAFAALDRAQDTEDVKNIIDNLVTDLEASKSRVREAFDITYEYRGGLGEKPESGRGASGSFGDPAKPGKTEKDMTDEELLKALGL